MKCRMYTVINTMDILCYPWGCCEIWSYINICSFMSDYHPFLLSLLRMAPFLSYGVRGIDFVESVRIPVQLFYYLWMSDCTMVGEAGGYQNSE